MKTLALALSAFGLVALGGVARADQKTQNTEKTDSSTTLGGKHKITRDKKVERADGSSMETRVETTTPKDADKRDADRATARHEDGDNGVNVKTSEHTTLTGKKQMKTTRKVEHPDGSETDTTTTRTEPKR